tara:strand:+ start:353 stop:1324 length:972 start_codon:yes stop_codon:yes gene_type:complete
MFLRIAVIFVFVIFGCNSKKDSQIQIVDRASFVPKFNSDSAYYFIEKQVQFGPRYTGSEGWRECSFFLEEKLNQYADTVLVQRARITTYDQKEHLIKNFIASFSPEKKNRIVFFAHWDTRPVADHDIANREDPILGANDGGSGVGLLLEMARIFKIRKPKIGIDIIFFDAEDYGQPENSKFPLMEDSWCLGSQYWAKNLHRANYSARYGILVDMVAGEKATFYQEGVSAFYASDILDKVWKTGHRLGYADYFIYEKSPEIIDDHYYVNKLTDIPTIDVIEFDPNTKNHFNKHWHTHKDNMDNINKNTLKAVGQTLLHVAYNGY